MIRLAVPILILLLLLAGAVWAWRGYFDLPDFALAPSKQEPATASKANAPADKQADRPDAQSNAAFDVARINPEGVSVFAGRAEPGARVTVMGDGEPVGTAQADTNGEWTLATEHHFANDDPKLALVAKKPSPEQQREQPETSAASEERQVVAAREDAEDSSTASAVSSQLLKNLKGMVENARSEMRAKELTADDPSALPQGAAAPGSLAAVGPALTPAAQLARTEPTPRKSVPLPIMFVFNEATMTGEGRKAASLLLEYLQLKHFDKVTLTGHADERGTEELNMRLSRERLEAVARLLRAGGYEGDLALIPKGETEPFTGVVRSEYAPEDLYQLDRRVELVITP